MNFVFLPIFICAFIANADPMSILQPVKQMSLLEKFKENPDVFVSEMSEADPEVLRQILALLDGLLTTSENREGDLVANLDQKQNALNDANGRVIAAQDILAQAVRDQDAANAAVSAADADLAATQAEQGQAQTERDDAQQQHDSEIDSLNDEQAVLRQVIDILTNLLEQQPAGECAILYGQDIRSGTFVHIPNDGQHSNSDEECQSRCSEHLDCTGWVRQPSTGNCWLTTQTGLVDFENENDRNGGLRCEGGDEFEQCSVTSDVQRTCRGEIAQGGILTKSECQCRCAALNINEGPEGWDQSQNTFDVMWIEQGAMIADFDGAQCFCCPNEGGEFIDNRYWGNDENTITFATCPKELCDEQYNYYNYEQ